jgi:hypothetical protein
LPTRVTIVDVSGRRLSQFNINHAYTIVPTIHLTKGIDWIDFADGSTVKLVKEYILVIPGMNWLRSDFLTGAFVCQMITKSKY